MLRLTWMEWKLIPEFKKSRPTENKYMEERKKGHIRLI